MSSLALATALMLVGSPSDQASPPTGPERAVLAVTPSAAPRLIEPTTTPPSASEISEIVVTGRRHGTDDPLARINASSFAATEAIDSAAMRPMMQGYQAVVPSPARDGIRNLLNNLREPVVFLNYLLQIKPGKAAETFGRFAINSTIGGAGLVDIARRKPFRLPRRPNGFADTLGFYGVKTGAFLYLPIIGPTTVRDLIGSTVDRFILPFAVGGPFRNVAVTIPLGVLSTLDHRIQFDETLGTLRHDTPDAYIASRDFYLARRQAEIDELRGRGRRIVRPNPGSVKPLILDVP